MSRRVVLNMIVVGCLCTNCYLVLENSQSLAEGHRLQVNMRRESTRTFRDLAILAAVLYATVVSSTLCCISDVVFLCSQCTGNEVCLKVFLLWNAFDIVVTFVCDIALYYLVKSVNEEGFRVLHIATATTREDTTSLDYVQGNVMERYPFGLDRFDSDYETTTEGVTTTQPSFPRKIMAFTQKIKSKTSLPQIFLVAIFKVLVLVMIKQYSDQQPPLMQGGSDHESSNISHMSTSQIAAWKAAYTTRRSTLHSIQERTLEMQAKGIGEAALTSRSVVTAPPSVAKTEAGARPESTRPGESSNTQRCLREGSLSSAGLLLNNKGLPGKTDAGHQTVELVVHAGGARPTPAASTANASTPSRVTTSGKSSVYCDAEKDVRRPECLRRNVPDKMPAVSEEPTSSSKVFVTAEETLTATRLPSCTSSKRPLRFKP